MIKLKKLIQEAGGPMNMWRTPEGTPDQVITILHHIMAQIIKKGENANDYVSLHRYKKGGEVYWEVTNKKASDRGLVYKEKEQSWYSTGALTAPLSPIILNAFIKRWVVDKLGESKNPTFRWNTPDNTPDSVVQVMHLLSAMLMKRGENPKEFVGIFHDAEDTENPFVKGDWWMLVNKKRPSDSLHYNADENTWNSSLGAFKFEPLNKNELKMALQNWG